MNFYQDEHLEQRLRKITNQISLLVLDSLLVSLKRIDIELQILKEFENTREKIYLKDESLPF